MKPEKKHGNTWKGGKHLSHGYVRVLMPEHLRANPNGYVFEHIIIAEKALGKPLPKGVEIHHHGAKDDQSQIVICENHAYHCLLHLRMKSIKACGHASWRKCQFCKKYDKPTNLFISDFYPNVYHRLCVNNYQNQRNQKARDRKT